MPGPHVLLLTGLSLLAALPASAQSIYRCTTGNTTTFSDRPCPDSQVTRETPTGTVQPSTTARPTTTATAVPAPRYTPPVAPGGVLPSAAELARRCETGDAGACDFLACANRNDKSACARAQGAPQGRTLGAGTASDSRWTAVSTRDVQRPQKDEASGLRMVREQEIVIECEGGKRGLVTARRDIGRYRLPDGSALGSLEAAATAVCAH